MSAMRRPRKVAGIVIAALLVLACVLGGDVLDSAEGFVAPRVRTTSHPRGSSSIRRAGRIATIRDDDASDCRSRRATTGVTPHVCGRDRDGCAVDDTRRAALLKAASAFSVVSWVPFSPFVDEASARGIKPDVAFGGLVKAREELLSAAKTYMLGGKKPDYDGLRAFLEEEAGDMNDFESNALALLESKQLDAESKKEIVTIRRYGVGADVMIMYGGLKGELENDEPNFGEVQKYLKRTLDSLDEVIAICRSNGF